MNARRILRWLWLPLLLALAAYATYVINAGQFLWKLRLARLDAEAETMAENRTMAEVVA